MVSDIEEYYLPFSSAYTVEQSFINISYYALYMTVNTLHLVYIAIVSYGRCLIIKYSLSYLTYEKPTVAGAAGRN